MDRIVEIISPGHMFDSDVSQGFVCIKEGTVIDLQTLETTWFGNGGDKIESFYHFLLKQDGIEDFPVESWVINYQ